MTTQTEPRAVPTLPFVPFPKIARLNRDMILTEKIDGTNASIHITPDGQVSAGSRTRWITPQDDNFGFAAWVRDHADELRQLGPGTHFGEWWGRGIQRGYGLDERRFSLFNVSRWHSEMNEAKSVKGSSACIEVPCCHVVPLLEKFTFNQVRIEMWLDALQQFGSAAADGFMKPEGIVVYHAASMNLYKVTLDKNDGHKGAVAPQAGAVTS